MGWYGWKPYVPVAVRRAKAVKKMEKMRKNGLKICPVCLEGRLIAKTFWGKAWCDHLESFSDYENRLPRGRSYLRNGSVCHLEIGKGEINAMVSGSELYNVRIEIHTLSEDKWKDVKKRCAGQIGSLLELLQGRLSKNVMSVVTDRNNGLFPLPKEIKLSCSCPDWAVMCKHVAAVLYGIGARLDEHPELLFLLRGVDHLELIEAEVGLEAATLTKTGRRRIAAGALADVFDIEISEGESPQEPKAEQGIEKKAPRFKQKDRITSPVKAKGKAEAVGSRMKKKSPLAKTARKKSPQLDLGLVTGRGVAELRSKFGMSQGEFAKLLSVSAQSIANWEKRPGELGLQSRTLKAWNVVKALTPRKARQKLYESSAALSGKKK